MSKRRIICGKCGFVTHDAEDMIRHLSLTQKVPGENCRERYIKVEDVEKHSDSYENGKEALERLRKRNI